MAAKSEELARETAEYRCTECQHRVHVIEGIPIPICSNCGNDTFVTGFARWHEPAHAAAARPLL